jgi:DNA-binding response OmpR family regulator
MAKDYILYVEDEEFQAKVFGKIINDEIEEFGYKLIALKGGDEAMKIISGEKMHGVSLENIGMILLDLAMHDVSGFQILKEIKGRKIKIPTAILSAKEDDEVKEEAIKLGAKDYFVKGKDLEELNRLRRFIIKTMDKNNP